MALSSCEAEYIASCSTTFQVVWIEVVFTELIMNIQVPIKLLVDNKYAINLARNIVTRGRSKHIETRFHYIRD